jgi:O-antigen/teichoic acid export membrane protein
LASTLAVLPIAVVAGAIRNLRLHFGDQVFLLMERTKVTIVINGIEVIAVVAGCTFGLVHWGLAGAAAGCLAGICVGFVVCFALAIRRHGLQLPLDHVARITVATSVMALVLAPMTWTSGVRGLAAEIATGILVYVLALAALYPTAVRRGCRQFLALT